MRCRFVSLRRIAAFSVAVTLVVTPIASAQTPASASANDAPAGAVLLSPTAFARLVQQPQTDVAAAPAVAGPRRIDLLDQGRAAVARQAQTAPTQAPQQSWAAKHKKGLITTAVLATVGLVAFWYAFTHGGD